MNSVLTSDIFFFITSVAVAIVTTLIIIILIYIIKLVRDLRGIAENVRKGTDAITEDVAELRMKLKDKGLFSALIMTIIQGFSRRSSTHKGKKEENR